MASTASRASWSTQRRNSAKKNKPARHGAPAMSCFDLAAESTRLCLPLRLRGFASRSSDSLEDRRHALPAAYAQADERVTPAAALKLARGGQCEPRSRGAERVADGDRAAIRIDAIVIERDLQPF